MFAACIWLAWLCRGLFSVLPHSLMNLDTAVVTLRGCGYEPSSLVTTCQLSSVRMPSRKSSSACSARHRRHSSTASDGNATVRDRPLMPYFSRIRLSLSPVANYPALATTASSPLSRPIHFPRSALTPPPR